MAHIQVSSDADADVAGILAYLAQKAGSRVAAKYRSLIENCFDMIGDHPLSGFARPALGGDARIRLVRPFIVIYAYDKDSNTAIILRIVHGHRDVTEKLLKKI